ncbi:MAG: metallophosphoesterase family protein [Tannerellaceae bacterium]
MKNLNDVLKKGTVTCLLLAIGISDVVAQEIEVPQIIREDIQATSRRMTEYIGKDQVLVFPILTDLHLTSSGAYDHIDYTVEAGKLMHFDFVVNLGDLGLDVGTETTEKAVGLMQDVYHRHSKFDGVTLFVRGNHDGNVRYNPVTAQAWYEQFNKSVSQAQAANYHFETTYGYYDIPKTKTRVIVLDTSDGSSDLTNVNYYNLSDMQLQWLANSLQFDKKGWNVIVLTHFCMDLIGKWTGFPYEVAAGDTAMNAMLHDFMLKKSGGMGAVAWDFRKNKSNALVANFCGDSHFDNSDVTNGLVRVITQGYGGVSEADVPPGGHVWSKDGRMLVDVVVVKPKQREFKMFRLGVGEDRLFRY